MNITSYKEASRKGLVKIERYGPDFMMVKRKFDPDTGTETTPEAQAFKRDDLLKQREAHATSIAEIDALLADIDALK